MNYNETRSRETKIKHFTLQQKVLSKQLKEVKDLYTKKIEGEKHITLL